MKKLLTALAIFALIFAACDDGNGNDETTLTIINLSDFADLQFSFGDTVFTAMARGGEATKKVSAGTKYVTVSVEYFFQNKVLTDLGYLSISQHFEVNEVLTCEEGKNNQFTFTNNTVVTMISGIGSDSEYKNFVGLTTGTLRNILNSIEQYFIAQN